MWGLLKSRPQLQRQRPNLELLSGLKILPWLLILSWRYKGALGVSVEATLCGCRSTKLDNFGHDVDLSLEGDLSIFSLRENMFFRWVKGLRNFCRPLCCCCCWCVILGEFFFQLWILKFLDLGCLGGALMWWWRGLHREEDWHWPRLGGLQTEIHRNTEIQKYRNTEILYTISTMSSMLGFRYTLEREKTTCWMENERGERGRKKGEWTKGGRVASRLLYLDKPGIS